ncbi:uncharacterized protein KGF55_000524 [Candida pseudojiufengensis]|uniref:uncharacterized protein n=1 Tax=Candida pseudojiufengensis TaxID=497109 RepID=UPI002224EDD8|nr:uncharacterized protein KGF55_000524 [Candida pseudojiufengensis]KAI5966215.1 hypothetical protein KGF55_000524 [Candida pseudojiufengensis]
MEAFRRIQNISNNKGIPEFNEDAGADIGELTSGANLSFDDITHIRNKGIYNSSSNLDTAPIIPTLGSLGSASSFNNVDPLKLNNVQYRKQMNQQKKLAMLTGARANSLAANGGNNPMFQGGNNNLRANSLATGVGNPMLYNSSNNSASSMNNPRANSLATNMGNPMMQQSLPPQQYMPNQQQYQFSQQDMGLEPRTQSMVGNNARNNMQMQGGYPRTQSLNPQAPVNMNYNQQQQNPQFQHRQQPPLNPNQTNYNQNQMQNGAPRTMSLMGSGQGMIPGNQAYPRTKSLGGVATMNQFQQQRQQAVQPQNQNYPQNPQFTQRQQPLYNQGNPQNSNHQMLHQNQSYFPNQQYPSSQTNQQQFQQPQQSRQMHPQRQSLPPLQEQQNMQLYPNNQSSQNDSRQFVAPPQPQYTTLQENSSDSLNDVMEEEEPQQLSESNEEEDVIYKFDEDDNKGIQISRKSTLKKNNSMRVRKLNLFNDSSNENDSDDKSSTTLRRKRPPVSPYEANFNNSYKSETNAPNLASFEEEEKDQTSNHPDESTEDDATIQENDSVKTYEKDQSQPHTIYKQPSRNISESHSFKNLVANTAFNNFRSPSISSNSNFANSQLMKTDSPTSFYEASQSPMPTPIDNNSDTDESEFRRQDHPFYTDENNENNGNLTPPTASTSNISQHKESGINGSNKVINSSPNHKFETDEHGNDTTCSIPVDITEPIQDVSEEQREADRSRGEFNPMPSSHDNIPSNPSRTPTTTSLTSGERIQPNSISRNSTSGSNTSKPGLPKVLSSASISSQQSTKKEKRSSFSGKNFLKRLSKSKRSSISNVEEDIPISSAASSRRASLNQRIPSSSTIGSIGNDNKFQTKQQPQQPQPITFTKEQMHIMNCNNELLNELELITRELASSIKRELALENKLKQQDDNSRNNRSSPISSETIEFENLEKTKKIVELQEKLNKEKRLRFISEQHALLQENGITPSPLKLNYEKTEIYNQLVLKNDEVNQLNLKIRELESSVESKNQEFNTNQAPPNHNQHHQQQQQNDFNSLDNNLIEKFQFLKFDNEELKSQTIQLNEEILVLKQQRDELRDVINKLSNQNFQEIKILNDKIKNLEIKNQNLKNLNIQLSNRGELVNSSFNSQYENDSGDNSFSNGSSSMNHGNVSGTGHGSNMFKLGMSGGKLNGFTIVSPNKKFNA